VAGSGSTVRAHGHHLSTALGAAYPGIAAASPGMGAVAAFPPGDGGPRPHGPDSRGDIGDHILGLLPKRRVDPPDLPDRHSPVFRERVDKQSVLASDYDHAPRAGHFACVRCVGPHPPSSARGQAPEVRFAVDDWHPATLHQDSKQPICGRPLATLAVMEATVSGADRGGGRHAGRGGRG